MWGRAVLSIMCACALAGCAAPSATPTVLPGFAPAAATVTAHRTSASSTTGRSASRSTSASRTQARTSATATEPTPPTVRGVLLVNRTHRLPASYVPAWIGTDPDGLAPDVRHALTRLFADADKAGYRLTVRSGYRSYATQKALYQRSVAEDGAALANRYNAPPGASEHQTGLAVDVSNAANVSGFRFRKLPEARWVVEHATDYGFIIRYPDGGESITGYAAEPWHLRYVGPEIAAAFAQRPGWTLEEYLGQG